MSYRLMFGLAAALCVAILYNLARDVVGPGAWR